MSRVCTSRMSSVLQMTKRRWSKERLLLPPHTDENWTDLFVRPCLKLLAHCWEAHIGSIWYLQGTSLHLRGRACSVLRWERIRCQPITRRDTRVHVHTHPFTVASECQLSSVLHSASVTEASGKAEALADCVANRKLAINDK